MILDLDDELRVNVVDWNWTLQERFETKDKDGELTGEYRWKVVGHYPSLRAVMCAVPEHLCGKLNTIEEVQERLVALAENLQEKKA